MIDWPAQLVGGILLTIERSYSWERVYRKTPHRKSNPTCIHPHGEEFLRAALDRCDHPKRHIEKLLKRHDYLTACEIIKIVWRTTGMRLYTINLSHRVSDPQTFHRDIFQLDSRIVLTQNVDRCLRCVCRKRIKWNCLHQGDSNADVGLVVRGERRCVLKAHGSVDTPAKMVFSREDYARARVEFSSILQRA